MTFEAIERKCLDCGMRFPTPLLGDFSYGSFIFCGERGGVFGYFEALNSAAWDYIESAIVKVGHGYQAECEHGESLQAACAHFADAIKGEKLRPHPICPRCSSSNTTFQTSGHIGEIEAYPVTHSNFLAMPQVERRRLVIAFNQSFMRQEAL